MTRIPRTMASWECHKTSYAARCLQAESGLVQHQELIDILMDRTSKLSYLQADLKTLNSESASLQVAMDMFTPVVESVVDIYTASTVLVKQFPSCEIPFTQFLSMLRGSISVTMEDPDLLRVLKEELMECVNQTTQKVSQASDGCQGDEMSDVRPHSTKSDNVMQLLKVLCGVLTLSICNRWPARPAAFLKLQVVGKIERDMLSIHDSELAFFHDLLLGCVAPPSWALQPCEREGILPKKQIERVIFSLLKLSDDFTRATISAGCPWEPGECMTDIAGSPILTLQWLEKTYPLGTFEVIRRLPGSTSLGWSNDQDFPVA